MLRPRTSDIKIRRGACYHFPVPITDTNPAAQAVQLDIQRSMSGEQRPFWLMR